ncbi:MAG: hypothetical protein J6W96_06475, partial [Alphaproteobacteria bacterium]|nr:hypothetical protein [Alphaproteobacteria bacterium]
MLTILSWERKTIPTLRISLYKLYLDLFLGRTQKTRPFNNLPDNKTYSFSKRIQYIIFLSIRQSGNNYFFYKKKTPLKKGVFIVYLVS